ncbi:hypothetical protein FOIG_12601 [Fusarium odoratissimum NRRL 54006]|uniref:Uncharacterized protein n=2 Tax=Fusarium oxysporum species complex TaxID=171631 RepID=X0J0N1_FUSO5|nr:uncharacterized protein FOIG_12601 [Fusarium odoratissimum NRRL 54006]EXL94758.1 hypothetical protein FOIG_12601 [Fusarium odoratissimum NRRL 54006]TXC06356.1 hypothetical protein FocTR4_00010696 [Fusarium oxysporum f. sp. cubense]
MIRHATTIRDRPSTDFSLTFQASITVTAVALRPIVHNPRIAYQSTPVQLPLTGGEIQGPLEALQQGCQVQSRTAETGRRIEFIPNRGVSTIMATSMFQRLIL